MKKKDIPFNRSYEVSQCGRVFSKCRVVIRSDGTARTFPGIELAQKTNSKGYKSVSLCENGKAKLHKVHRLVLLTFLPIENPEGLDVNHKNGVKDDNHLENLEWCTRSENLKHAYAHLGVTSHMVGKFGQLHHRSVPIVGARDGAPICEFPSLMDAERAGYSAPRISDCLKGRRKSHQGLTWMPEHKPFSAPGA